MATITQIEIDGFKAFPENFVLDLEGGKNLLLYGENGSGKSSIYYALHAVFQSVLKDDRGAKYFKPEDEQHLININKVEDVENNDYQPFIRITFDNGDIWRLDRDGLTSENKGSYDTIKLLNRGSAFINHSYISRFHTARNSEEIDLWNVFHKDILPFYRAKENEEFLSVLFDNIKSDADDNPNMKNKSFLKRIDDFNDKLSLFIEDANKRIEKIYNENFKFDNDPELGIKLMYLADNADENPNHFPYYLFYGKIRNGQQRPKSLHIPKIGIIIKENGKEIQKPQTHFNEARLTAIALAVRFACLSKKSEGCFLALDDMLISLDMSNRTKVTNYLLNIIANQYKIYLFTHDKAFYDYICRAIKQSKNQQDWTYKIISHCPSKNAPLLLDSYGDYMSTAKHFYDIGDYETSAIYARKELEQSVGDLLPYELKVRADGGFVNLETLWKKLDRFYSNNRKPIIPSKKDLFNKSKLLILNVAAHYQRLSNPIYKIELEQVFVLIDYIHSLDKIEKKLIIPANKTIEFIHPSGNYQCTFELETDLVVEIGDHIVSALPKCQNLFWKYNDVEYYNFETGEEDRTNPLITAKPKLTNFILNMPEEIKVSEDDFISNCSIEGNRLDDYLCGIKFSQMVKA